VIGEANLALDTDRAHSDCERERLGDPGELGMLTGFECEPDMMLQHVHEDTLLVGNGKCLGRGCLDYCSGMWDVALCRNVVNLREGIAQLGRERIIQKRIHVWTRPGDQMNYDSTFLQSGVETRLKKA